MDKLPRPQAPAISRALFPGLIDWLESPWAGPPQFTAARSFRVEEMARDNRYVIRAELPGLDPEWDIEVTVEGRTLTIHAERRQEDSGPYRSEFRYGSLTRLVRLPARVDAKDVTARYDRGVLEVSVPAHEVQPEGIRVAIETQTSPGRNPRDGRNLPGQTHILDPGRRAAVILGGELSVAVARGLTSPGGVEARIGTRRRSGGRSRR